MIKITNEIGGKKYELVGESYLCSGCSFLDKRTGCILPNNQRRFGGIGVCGKLGGVWKEVKDGKKG